MPAAGAEDVVELTKESTMKLKQPVLRMNSSSFDSKSSNPFPLSLLLAAAFFCVVPEMATRAATSGQKTFASPEDAVHALSTAVNNRDTNALAAIFGPGLKDVKSADPIEAQDELTDFTERLNASNHIDHARSDRCILDIGEGRFPFAIPIVEKGGSWYFDTEEGKQEVLDRRVGRNELEALQSVRAYVDAQREYANKDRDGSEVLKYAQKIMSTSGKKDGLYWAADNDADESPLGPMFAEAQHQNYLEAPRNEVRQRQPFHGYYFKILNQQGKHAPGGAYSYVINSNMIGGFALVAWPADYGALGVMTFMVNQQGKVYQKDLGPDTDSIASKIKTYDPDPSWKVSPE